MTYVNGQYVKKFESGSRGCNVISQCGNDWGASYGTYQLTLRWGNVFNFLKKKFPKTYEEYKLYFNTNKGDFESKVYVGEKYCSPIKTVNECWNKCIEKVGKEEFEKREHDYIKSVYYDVTSTYFKTKYKVDVDTLSIGWKESIWSCSVRDGSKTAFNIFDKAIGKASFTQTDFDKYYDAREKIHTDGGRWKKGNNSMEREQLRIFLDDYTPVFKSISKISPIPHIMWLQYKLGNLVVDGEWGKATANMVNNFFRVKGWKLGTGYAVGNTTIKVLSEL